MSQWIDLSEQEPPKGEDILVLTYEGDTHEVYRCKGHGNGKCTEWKCSLTGCTMWIDVKSWRLKYENA